MIPSRPAVGERRSWLGLMSGTSCDGIDAVRLTLEEAESGPRRIECRGGTIPFEPDFARALREVLVEGGSAAECARWDARLGERFAAAARHAIEERGPVDGIALSGHTFAHLSAESPRSTLQLGSPAIVAERTGRPVLGGFRAMDVARGGEGAPLVPAGDRVLFGALGARVAVINIGGISNVTWLVRGEEPQAIDCGPGNLVLDAVHRAARPDGEGFDRGGCLALRGRVDADWLARVGEPALRAAGGGDGARRTFGREEFGEAFARSAAGDLDRLPLEDRLATLAAWITGAIAAALERLAGADPLDRVLIGGGGAANEALRAGLQESLGVEIEPLQQEVHGVSADLREAAAFATLCHEWVCGRPGSFPGTSGAAAVPGLGSWTLPCGPLPR